MDSEENTGSWWLYATLKENHVKKGDSQGYIKVFIPMLVLLPIKTKHRLT